MMRILACVRRRARLAGPSGGRFWLAWYGHRELVMLAAALCMAMLATMAAPRPAYALKLIDDVGNVINAIPNAPNYLMTAAAENMKNINTGQLTNDFDKLIGPASGASTVSPYTFVKEVHGTVVKGLGYSVLVIVYLVQLVRIANKFESNGVMPQVKEVIFLLLGFVIIKYLIDNSLVICEGVYTAFNELIKQLPGYDPGSTNVYDTDLFGDFNADKDGGTVTIPQTDASGNVIGYTEESVFGDSRDNWIGNMLTAVIMWLVSYAAQVVAYFVVFARAFQIYIYAILAPIPLSMLGVEETRSWGMGFIKSFVAACLAGVLIAMMVLLWPMCVASAMATAGSFTVKAIAICGILIFGLAKTGSWAREIIGG